MEEESHKMELIRRPDGYVLPVSGQRITRCCIDNEAVVLLLINMLEIRISEPFTLASSNGDVHLLNPDPSLETMRLSPILGVMRKTITEGIAFEDGALALTFDDGKRIEVPPGSEYEAWTLAGPGGPNGLKIVSTPDGGLAIWEDRR
jgi:hypothetical protein